MPIVPLGGDIVLLLSATLTNGFAVGGSMGTVVHLFTSSAANGTITLTSEVVALPVCCAPSMFNFVTAPSPVAPFDATGDLTAQDLKIQLDATIGGTIQLNTFGQSSCKGLATQGFSNNKN